LVNMDSQYDIIISPIFLFGSEFAKIGYRGKEYNLSIMSLIDKHIFLWYSRPTVIIVNNKKCTKTACEKRSYITQNMVHNPHFFNNKNKPHDKQTNITLQVLYHTIIHTCIGKCKNCNKILKILRWSECFIFHLDVGEGRRSGQHIIKFFLHSF